MRTLKRPSINSNIFLILFTAGYFVLSFFVLLRAEKNFNLYFFTSWFLAMSVVYAILIFVQANTTSLKKIVLSSLLFSLILLPIFPISSDDVFHYILQAKVLTHYGQNPFTFSAFPLNQDIFRAFIYPENISYPTVYGPVFMVLSSLPIFLFGSYFILAIFSIKAMFIIFHLLNAVLVYAIVKKKFPGMAKLAAALYAWNPLILFETALNAHNDVIMIFFILLALFFYAQKKYIWAFPTFLLACMTKYIALLVLPLFAVFLIKKVTEKRASFYLQTGILSALFVLTLYGFFWKGIETFDGILAIKNFVLANTILPAAISSLTGLQPNEFRSILFGMYISVYVFLVVRLWKRAIFSELVKSFALSFFWYLALASTWLTTWYFLWPLSFTYLVGKNKYLWISAIITAIGLLSNIFSFLSLFITFLIIAIFMKILRYEIPH